MWKMNICFWHLLSLRISWGIDWIYATWYSCLNICACNSFLFFWIFHFVFPSLNRMKKSFIMKWTYKHDIFHGLSSLNSNFLTNCECSQIYFIYSYIGILGTNVFYFTSLLGWKHITATKKCCHKYYFLKLCNFQLSPN